MEMKEKQRLMIGTDYNLSCLSSKGRQSKRFVNVSLKICRWNGVRQ